MELVAPTASQELSAKALRAPSPDRSGWSPQDGSGGPGFLRNLDTRELVSPDASENRGPTKCGFRGYSWNWFVVAPRPPSLSGDNHCRWLTEFDLGMCHNMGFPEMLAFLKVSL